MPRIRQRGVPELGHRISQFMHDQELTVSDLAARSGISQSYLSRLVTGEVTNPTIVFVLRIAHALGMTVSQLLGEESPPASPQQQTLYDTRLADLQKQINELRTALEDLRRDRE